MPTIKIEPRRRWCAGLAAWIAIGLVSIAPKLAAAADLGAAPPPEAPPVVTPDNGWQFRFAPYGWATSLNGSSTVRGVKTDVNIAFPDIIQKSDSVLALMSAVEARHDRWMVFGDANWMRLTGGGAKPNQRTLPSGVDLATSLSADVTLTTFIGEAALGYEVMKWPWSGSSATAVDLFGGLRYWNQTTDVKLNLTAAGAFSKIGFTVIGTRAIGKSGTLEWTDPIVGFRVRHSLSPLDDLQFRADIGGFGVGSKFSWQLFGGYSHRFMWGSQPVDAVIGYRALSADYSQGQGNMKAGMNMVMHGPIIGAAFDF